MPQRHHLISLSFFLAATLALCAIAFFSSTGYAKTIPEFNDFNGPFDPADSFILWDASAAGHSTDPNDPSTVEATGRQLFAPFAADPTWSADFSASAWRTALDTYSTAEADAAFDASGSAAVVQVDVDAHTADVANPHSVTAEQVGLGNVDNTADLDKPVSTATQRALDIHTSLTTYSPRGIRSDGADFALTTAARDFSTEDHTVRIVAKRPETDAVLWSNQPYYGVADNLNVFEKIGNLVAITNRTLTGCDFDDQPGAFRNGVGALAGLLAGQVVVATFDLSDGSALSNLEIRNSSYGSGDIVSNRIYTFTTGTNTLTFTLTADSNAGAALDFTSAGLVAGSVSNFSVKLLPHALGERLIWQQDGKLKQQFGNGTDWTTHEFVTDQAAFVPVGAVAEIVTTIDRANDELIHYVNARQTEMSLGGYEYIDISGAAAVSLDTAAPWRLLSDSSAHSPGAIFEQFCLESEAINASIVAERSADPSLWMHSNARSILLGQWDWSTTLDGWTEANVATVAGQSIGGEDDWLKVVPDSTLSSHTIRIAGLPSIPSGTDVTLKYKAYLPSGQAVDFQAIKTSFFRTDGAAQSSSTTITPTQDQIHDQVLHLTTTDEVGKIYIWLRTTAETYAGDNVSAVYLKDVYLSINGLERAIDVRVSGTTKPDRIGSNDGTLGSTGVTDTDPLSI